MESETHPTIGGLRIGNKLNERKPYEPMDHHLEWDQTGNTIITSPNGCMHLIE